MAETTPRTDPHRALRRARSTGDVARDGLSLGAFTAAVVALVLSQLVPVILESVAPSVSDRSPWLVQITVALSMSFGVLVGFGAGYRAVARHGSTLVREGWDEKIVGLAVTILPWIAYLVWLWWQIQ